MKRIILLLSIAVSASSSYSQTTVAIVADKDNTMFSQFPNNSNGSGQYFFAGKNSANNNGSVQRALLHFDLSAIPAGATISSATLTVYISKSAPAASGIELHKVNAEWGEGTSDAALNEGAGATATTNDATWNTRLYAQTPWATPGGDFVGTSSATIATVNAGISSPTAFSMSGSAMVSDVQSWLTTTSTNFGWLIKATNESPEASVKRFVSRNNSVVAQRPTLTITYTQVLPIVLKNFSASVQKQDAIISWETSSETGNKYFEVQHSRDGYNFETIGKVDGAGIISTDKQYSLTHRNIGAGKHMYRLVQYDFNGNKKLSQVISLSFGSANNLTVYPNPASSFIKISGSTLPVTAEYSISSIMGNSVKKGRVVNQQVDVQQLAPGNYWITIQSNNGEISRSRFFKN